MTRLTFLAAWQPRPSIIIVGICRRRVSDTHRYYSLSCVETIFQKKLMKPTVY